MELKDEKRENESVLESISKLEATRKSSEVKRGPNEEYEVVCCTRDKDRDK